MPPVRPRLRHLFIAGTRQSFSFTTPNQGGRKGGPKYPQRDPEEHGSSLVSELSRIVGTQPRLLGLRQNHEVGEVTGSPVTFDLILNPDLSLDSLEDRTSGIELLSFRSTGKEAGVATVFVPEGRLEVFERKLRDYLNPEKITKKGLRRNQALIHSIERIRRTVLEDLWTDPVREFPGEEPGWWEVWVRNQAGIDRFRSHAGRLGITTGRQILRFPDRTVVLAHATVGQMALSVELLDSVAELREARLARVAAGTEFFGMDPQTVAERIESLANRTRSPLDGCPAVCLLDTGIEVSHPLLRPGLKSDDAHAYDEANWGVDDHHLHSHGTQMAGFALYGAELDLLLLSEEVVELQHRLESVKILPRHGSNPPELYGEITLASAARVESYNPQRRRVFSLSVTGGSCPEGRPTSWSAAIDQLCMGADEDEAGSLHRLLFVASGNADTGEGYSYPDSNHTDCVQDPAQAWNALTVGAYTEKTLFRSRIA